MAYEVMDGSLEFVRGDESIFLFPIARPLLPSDGGIRTNPSMCAQTSPSRPSPDPCIDRVAVGCAGFAIGGFVGFGLGALVWYAVGAPTDEWNFTPIVFGFASSLALGSLTAFLATRQGPGRRGTRAVRNAPRDANKRRLQRRVVDGLSPHSAALVGVLRQLVRHAYPAEVVSVDFEVFPASFTSGFPVRAFFLDKDNSEFFVQRGEKAEYPSPVDPGLLDIPRVLEEEALQELLASDPDADAVRTTLARSGWRIVLALGDDSPARRRAVLRPGSATLAGMVGCHPTNLVS